jgi:hypothetical protein
MLGTTLFSYPLSSVPLGNANEFVSEIAVSQVRAKSGQVTTEVNNR